MKQLIRRFSRVADSSTQYILLRQESRPVHMNRRSENKKAKYRRSGGPVPEGHIPVFVGEEMERFVVCAKFLNHPIFLELLNKSAQEYGYEQQGVLRIPCQVIIFEKVLQILEEDRLASDKEVEEILRLFSQEFL
ncbi:auxin-responsive protein SAUR71-like [Tasmannia lanceolata]|uniref:auxin-responsive protein SAUR71-like n=1 Tax=Tasmannia lanceolata TaxID=3420 RepID=UPI004062994A